MGEIYTGSKLEPEYKDSYIDYLLINNMETCFLLKQQTNINLYLKNKKILIYIYIYIYIYILFFIFIFYLKKKLLCRIKKQSEDLNWLFDNFYYVVIQQELRSANITLFIRMWRFQYSWIICGKINYA